MKCRIKIGKAKAKEFKAANWQELRDRAAGILAAHISETGTLPEKFHVFAWGKGIARRFSPEGGTAGWRLVWKTSWESNPDNWVG